jgi:DNA-binding transcriptional MerR regulator
MAEKELVSLNELSKEFNINKSRLAFYVKLGLLSPKTTVGKMNIFEYGKSVGILKQIDRLQKKDIGLNEIKFILDNKK